MEEVEGDSRWSQWGCLVLFRESGSGQDVSEVSGEIPFKRQILLITRNISSLVIDTLCDRAAEENIAVVGLYCDYLSQQDQTVTNTMGAILKQLMGRGGISKDVREAFQKGKMEFGGRGPRLADLIRMLKIAIASLPQVIICLDALDECLPKYLPELLESLGDLIRECPKTRIFLTGRPHVREGVQRHFSKVVVVPISPSPSDVRNYVEMRLNRDDEPDAMNKDLRADIIRVILEKISDMCVGEFAVSTLSKMNTY